MKELKVTQDKLQRLYAANEALPSQTTVEGRLKGELMIEIADLLEKEEKPEKKEVEPGGK